MPKTPPKQKSPHTQANELPGKKSRSPIPPWASNTLLLLGGLVVGLALLEGFARWLRPAPPPPEKMENHFQVESTPNSRMVYRILPNSRFVTFGVSYPTNEFGFRDDPVTEKNDETFRILCVGDSVTFGTGVKNDETFPNQLEGMLRDLAAENWKVDVVNAGVSAYNAVNVLGLLETHLEDLRPEVVVYTFVENDLDDSLSAGPDGRLMYFDPGQPPDAPHIQREFPAIWWGTKQAASPARGAVRQILANLSREVPHDALPLLVGEHPEPVRRWREFARTMEEMKARCTSVGADFIVYSFAARNHSEPAIRKVEEICRNLGVPHASTLPIFDKRTYMKEHSLGYDAHCNPLGNRLMAERLKGFLAESGLLPEEVFPALPTFPDYPDGVDDAIADRLERKALEAPSRIAFPEGRGIRGMLGGVDPMGRMARYCLFRLGPGGDRLEVEVKGLVTAPGRSQQAVLAIEGEESPESFPVSTDWEVYTFPIPERLHDRPLEFELRIEGPAWIPSPIERRQAQYPYTAAIRRLERK